MKKNKKSKINFLEVNQDEESSRFVVDLTADKDAPDKEVKVKKKQDYKALLEKVLEFEPKKSWHSFKDKAFGFTQGFKSENELQFKPFPFSNSIINRVKQLAFISIFKLVFKVLLKIINLVYHLSYMIGWLVVFIIRFFGLGLGRILKYSFIGFKKIGYQLRIVFREFFTWQANIFKKISHNCLVFTERISLRLKEKYQTWKISRPIKIIHQPKPQSESVDTSLVEVIKKTFNWRPVLSFAVLLLLIAAPFKIISFYKSFNLAELKGEVLGITEAGMNDLRSASESIGQLEFSRAEKEFSQAGDNFLQAQEQLEEINNIFFSLASIVPHDEIKLAAESKKILKVGSILAELGKNLNLAFDSLFNPHQPSSRGKLGADSTEVEGESREILAIIDNFSFYSVKALANTNDLNKELANINYQALPAEHQNKFLSLKDGAIKLEQGLSSFVGIVSNLREFLGANQDKRYLLVFQNNTELRATGGFIGSFAIIDLREGEIKNIEVPAGGSYDTEGGLQVLEASPEPLHLVNPLWHFWDANWWPDWPRSARKLMWFYERSDGSTVDGVISFTPTVMEKLLAITGPIDMREKYGLILDADNFWLETQAIAEEKLTPEQIAANEKHEPKKIIGDLLEKIIDEIPKNLNKETLIRLLGMIEESLSEKQVLFYFTDQNIQAEISKRGWDGSIKNTSHDYLSVINTNIAGGKSDKRMKEEINLVTEVMPNGAIINTLKIKRTHTGIKNEPFSGVRNVNWLRVYVPEGSTLIEAQGFRQPDQIYFEEPDPSWQQDKDVYYTETTAKIHEPSGTKIYNEDNKTVFANWSMVDPGKSTTIYLKYKLAFSLQSEEDDNSLIDNLKLALNPTRKELCAYSIYVQKQSGFSQSEINTSLKLADNYKIVWKYPKDMSLTNDGWLINDNLQTDKYWAVLLEN